MLLFLLSFNFLSLNILMLLGHSGITIVAGVVEMQLSKVRYFMFHVKIIVCNHRHG